jgi:hypothetical protein
MPRIVSVKPFALAVWWRDRPELLHIASSYLRCGSLKDGTFRGREKVDMVRKLLKSLRRGGQLCGAHRAVVYARNGWQASGFVLKGELGCACNYVCMEEDLTGVGFLRDTGVGTSYPALQTESTEGQFTYRLHRSREILPGCT